MSQFTFSGFAPAVSLLLILANCCASVSFVTPRWVVMIRHTKSCEMRGVDFIFFQPVAFIFYRLFLSLDLSVLSVRYSRPSVRLGVVQRSALDISLPLPMQPVSFLSPLFLAARIYYDDADALLTIQASPQLPSLYFPPPLLSLLATFSSNKIRTKTSYCLSLTVSTYFYMCVLLMKDTQINRLIAFSEKWALEILSTEYAEYHSYCAE